MRSLLSFNGVARIALGLALALLTAAMLLLSMPPYGLWPLALLGFAPMLVAQHRILPARLASLAQAVGVGGFLGLVLLDVFRGAVALPVYMQALPLVIGVIVFFTEKGTRALHARTGYRWFVLQGALDWVGIEMIRNLIPSLGTGGFIAYAFYRLPWLVQPISVFSLFGLSLLAMLVASTLGLAALALYDRFFPADAASAPVPPRLAARWLAGVGAAVAAWALLGLALYQTPLDTPRVTVAAIQAKTPNLETFTALSRQAARAGARVIVWSEGGLSFDPQVQHTDALQALARETGAYLVLGVGLRTPQGLRNEATVLSPDGVFLGTYGKDHPMTFVGETSLTRGRYPVYATPVGQLATLICYDLNFNDTARKLAAQGAQLIAAPSNDWPGLSAKQYAYQMYRAIENRVTVVKADSAYGSMIFDPRGAAVRVHNTSAPSQAVVTAVVPLGTADAPQIWLGDWTGWFSLAGLLFFALPNPLLQGPAPATRPAAPAPPPTAEEAEA